ncbi:MAG: GLPGLI family protein [Bacteroidaceae bacterium]|nr:GLPGLI family protein [Bacteroidaceae bacterium]MBR5962808.1 GLPGLI family protein [Bacteroidaceae bacterium]
MKKIIVFLVTLVASSVVMNAQGIGGIPPLMGKKYAVLDSAVYRFSYTLHFISNVETGKVRENNLRVLIGSNYSKMENAYSIQNEGGGFKNVEGRGLGGTEVLKNLKERTMAVAVLIGTPREPFLYEEELPKQVWKVCDETQEILSYSCQKATTQYLGRDYTAWFTTKIPISNGPWKFGGLPGMILNVADAEGHYVFECTGIEQLKEKVPIVKYEFNYIKTTRKELNKVIKRMHDDLMAYIQSADPNVRVQIREGATAKQPYNPIERE